MFKHRELQPKLYRHNAVYKLTCSGGSVYNGLTRRNLQSHLHEHNPATNPTINQMSPSISLKMRTILLILIIQNFYVQHTKPKSYK